MKVERKLLFFACIVSGLFIIVVEVGLTVVATISPKVDKLLTTPEYSGVPEVVPDVTLGYRPNPAYAGHDNNGFRNSRVPAIAEIVALGDSQTYGVGVESEEAWPKQLESLMGGRVYSMAYGGYGPVHYLVLWKDAIKFKPGIVIVTFYSGNDLFDSFDFVYNQGKLPELKNSDSKVRSSIKDAEYRQSIAVHVSRLFAEMARPTETSSKNAFPIRGFLSKHSKLYGLARWTRREVFQHIRNNGWENAKAFAQTNSACCQIFEEGQFKTILTPEYRLAALDLQDIRIAEGYRISLEAIRQINGIANNHGTRFFVVLIPTKEMVFQQLVSNPSVSYIALLENEGRLWTSAKNFLKTYGIEFVDALPSLREQLSLGTQPYPVTSDGHPNKYGHTAIAKLVQMQIKTHSAELK